MSAIDRIETGVKSRPGQMAKPENRRAARFRSRGAEARGTPSTGRRFSLAGPASARDRQRLREREAAERERVERALAQAPLVLDESSYGTSQSSCSVCPICAAVDVVVDEVIQVGTLCLSQCLHCDHRWTRRSSDRWAEVGARMQRRSPPYSSYLRPAGAPRL